MEIPTSKETLQDFIKEYETRFPSCMEDPEIRILVIQAAMIKIARLHVEAALQAAAKKRQGSI